MTHSIVFVGGGNMAASLISGLRQSGHPGTAITVIEPEAQKRRDLEHTYNIRSAETASAELLTADVLVLAVKPQIMRAVAGQIRALLGDARPLVVSIAAGVPLAALREWLGVSLAYVRCMPNTPALVGAGASGLYADERVTEAERQRAESIVAGAGISVWVADESLLDAVTATSGSGPAYFFALMQAMQAGARQLGLDDDTARELVVHTALGAARMAIESGDDPATLRAKVASPGGTTEQALACFEHDGLDALVGRAMHAAAERARVLARELTGDTE